MKLLQNFDNKWKIKSALYSGENIMKTQTQTHTRNCCLLPPPPSTHYTAPQLTSCQWLVLQLFFFYWRHTPLWVCILQPSSGAIASSRTKFLDHTQRRATVGRTPLDEWSVRRRDLYLTTHNTHNRQTSMSRVGFEPTIAAGERPQTYALDRAANGTGSWFI